MHVCICIYNIIRENKLSIWEWRGHRRGLRCKKEGLEEVKGWRSGVTLSQFKTFIKIHQRKLLKFKKETGKSWTLPYKTGRDQASRRSLDSHSLYDLISMVGTHWLWVLMVQMKEFQFQVTYVCEYIEKEYKAITYYFAIFIIHLHTCIIYDYILYVWNSIKKTK